MSVSISGVQGYEYQYKITLLIYLIFHADKPQVFVEMEGNEDALLVLEHSNIKTRIQVQVKHEQGKLTTTKLVDWLCHFEERKKNASLLQRLIDKEDDIILFATRSRCADDTVFLKSEIGRLNIHEDLRVSKEQRKNIITSLEQTRHGTSKLMQEREVFDFDLAQQLKHGNMLDELLTRMVIWEEFSDEKVDSTIVHILTSKHQIASSQVNVAYLELLEVIRSGRNEQRDIQPQLLGAIQRRKIGRPITEVNYFQRGDENHLLGILQKNNVLLLTGLTLCGKSEVAKVIATSLFDLGYNYKQTNDVKDLKIFLASDISDHKIAILEDPWGHLQLSPGHEGIQRDIEQLLQNLQPHHHVIITTSLPRLFERCQTEDLQRCKILGLPWVDLTERKAEKANEYWGAIALQKKVDDSIAELVSKKLLASSGDHLLQIGQLKLLANYEKSELHNKSFHELEHIARRNSREIADWINAKDTFYSEVLAVLAMVSTSIIPINKLHLAFILSSDSSSPSLIDKSKPSIYFKDENREFPNYETLPYLDQRAATALEFLEERQLIKVSGDEFQFSHPNYYEAGRFLFFPMTQSRQQRLLEYLLRSVACTSPDNAYLATKQLQFFYSGIRSDLKPRVIEMGFASINSVFPAVEDVAIAFLSNNIRDIHGELLDKLIRLIQHGGTSSENISWYNGSIPFISYDRVSSKLFFAPDEAAVKRAEELLNSGTLPSIQDGWELLESLKDGRDVPAHYFHVLLNYKETFIRKRVVLQFFRRLNEFNATLVDEIFSDEHPSIVFTAIRGVFLNWTNFQNEVKSRLIANITHAISKEQVAIRASSLISTFAAHYGSEGIHTLDKMDEVNRKDIWNVWGLIYPIMANNLPPDGLFINTARFGATMDEALKYLEKDRGIEVFNAWFKRIDRQISSGLQPDDFEMGIMANLMEFTKQDSDLRQGLFWKLLTYTDTSFMLSNLKWAMAFWDNLNNREKSEILEVLDSSRDDMRWIKAVLLTRRDPPSEIVTKILGEPDVLQKDVPDMLQRMPDTLVQDCLNVFCGSPYPLSRIGVHSSNKSLWVKVMRYILLENYRVGYDLCLQEFLHNGVNGFSSMWENPEELWKLICKSASDKKKLTESLIFNIGSCSCSISSATMLWRILMHSYVNNNQESDFTKIVSSRIEMLQQTGHKEDLIPIMGREFINKKLIREIQPDFMLIETLQILDQLHFSLEEASEVFRMISSILNKTHIRFFLTFRYFDHIKSKSGIPEKIKDILNSFPYMIDEIGKSQIEEWDKKFEYSLANWNVGNKES